MDWQELVTVKKGNIGEAIVNSYLERMGFIPYSPDSEGAHPFDRLCASRDKKTIFIADSKAKPARTYYPDTGIDTRHYRDYMAIQRRHNLHVFIFFVDEDAGKVYGNFLHELDKHREIVHNGRTLNYPLVSKGIRYFPLVAMREIGEIPQKEVVKLRQLSTRNGAYKRSEL